MKKKLFTYNTKFHQAVNSYFEQIQQQETITTEEINNSRKVVEELLVASGKTSFPSKAKRTSAKKLFVTIGVAAASFAVLLFISFKLFIDNTYPTETTASIEYLNITAPNGEISHITLPDGTLAYIQAGSTLSYPSVFSTDKREIEVEGEVYLEVAHNPDVPFIVKTDGFDVRVLGTKFNVSSYTGSSSASVVLVEGSVQIETISQDKIKLQPNEMAKVNLKGTTIEQVDVSKYICWKDYYLLLDEESLGDVLERLSNYYGIRIYCQPELNSLLLSGKLNLKNSIDETIRVIHRTTKLDYEQTENEIRLYKTSSI